MLWLLTGRDEFVQNTSIAIISDRDVTAADDTENTDEKEMEVSDSTE